MTQFRATLWGALALLLVSLCSTPALAEVREIDEKRNDETIVVNPNDEVRIRLRADFVKGEEWLLSLASRSLSLSPNVAYEPHPTDTFPGWGAMTFVFRIAKDLPPHLKSQLSEVHFVRVNRSSEPKILSHFNLWLSIQDKVESKPEDKKTEVKPSEPKGSGQDKPAAK